MEGSGIGGVVLPGSWPQSALSLCSRSTRSLPRSSVTICLTSVARAPSRGGSWQAHRWSVGLRSLSPGGHGSWLVEADRSGLPTSWVHDGAGRGLPSARHPALLIPSCPRALADLASSGSLTGILQHFCPRAVGDPGSWVGRVVCRFMENGAPLTGEAVRCQWGCRKRWPWTSGFRFWCWKCRVISAARWASVDSHASDQWVDKFTQRVHTCTDTHPHTKVGRPLPEPPLPRLCTHQATALWPLGLVLSGASGGMTRTPSTVGRQDAGFAPGGSGKRPGVLGHHLLRGDVPCAVGELGRTQDPARRPLLAGAGPRVCCPGGRCPAASAMGALRPGAH